MMKAVVDSYMFTGYSFGAHNGLPISHLQFADDTLLVGTKSWVNVCALRDVLLLFESVSGLKVNFHKSMLTDINNNESWLVPAALALNCKMEKVPFVYLDLPIRGDARRLSFWEPVLTRITTRLSGWKGRFLSFGGRMILIKFVLSSLPVYVLSFFKSPSGKEEGGLGVRRMREFNIALLGQWC